MKDEVNKIKCSTGRSEEAMRRKKNGPLDFIGFAAINQSFPGRNNQLSLLFPEPVPGFRGLRHKSNVPRKRELSFVLLTVDKGIVCFLLCGSASSKKSYNVS